MKVVQIRAQKRGKKQCILSLGVGKKSYQACLNRLEESLRRMQFNGDFLFWDEALPEGSPSHFEAPFAFKSFGFYEAQRLGYQQALWIDSPCVAIRPLDPIFAAIEKNNYAIFTNNYGQMMGQWSSDEALAHNCITREEAMKIPEIPCSVIGLNLHSSLGAQFLLGWHEKLNDGITCRGTSQPIHDWDEYSAIAWNNSGRISKDPRVRGHRHDQTAAGIVAHQLGMRPYVDSLRDIHYKANPINRHTIILHHREFGEEITSLDTIYRQVFFLDPYIEKPREKARKYFNYCKRLAMHIR